MILNKLPFRMRCLYYYLSLCTIFLWSASADHICVHKGIRQTLLFVHTLLLALIHYAVTVSIKYLIDRLTTKNHYFWRDMKTCHGDNWHHLAITCLKGIQYLLILICWWTAWLRRAWSFKQFFVIIKRGWATFTYEIEAKNVLDDIFLAGN